MLLQIIEILHKIPKEKGNSKIVRITESKVEKGILIHKETHETTTAAHLVEITGAKTVVHAIEIIATTTLKSPGITFPTKIIHNTCSLSFPNKTKRNTRKKVENAGNTKLLRIEK